MKIRRHIAAANLLLAIFLGGLVAPLSHSIYMVACDSHAPEHVADSVPHHSESHANMVSLTSDSGFLQTPPAIAFECKYMDLLATQLVASTNDLGDSELNASVTQQVYASVDQVWVAPRYASNSERGPPARLALS